jgi:hypothetical protein
MKSKLSIEEHLGVTHQYAPEERLDQCFRGYPGWLRLFGRIIEFIAQVGTALYAKPLYIIGELQLTDVILKYTASIYETTHNLWNCPLRK